MQEYGLLIYVGMYVDMETPGSVFCFDTPGSGTGASGRV